MTMSAKFVTRRLTKRTRETQREEKHVFDIRYPKYQHMRGCPGYPFQHMEDNHA